MIRPFAADGGPDPNRTVISCTTEDVSLSGLRVRLPGPAPETGRVLDLWVSFAERTGTFLLTGTVQWARPAGASGDAVIGIAIREDPKDDLGIWRQALDGEALE